MKGDIFRTGDRVKVFDMLLFVDDKTTPLSTTMQPATVARGSYITEKQDDPMIDVIFDHRNTKISHGHFVWGVLKYER